MYKVNDLLLNAVCLSCCFIVGLRFAEFFPIQSVKTIAGMASSVVLFLFMMWWAGDDGRYAKWPFVFIEKNLSVTSSYEGLALLVGILCLSNVIVSAYMTGWFFWTVVALVILLGFPTHRILRDNA